MPADILSLSKARKAKTKAEKEATADRNRIQFGRTKAERTAAEKKAEIALRRLDGHKRTPNQDEPE